MTTNNKKSVDISKLVIGNDHESYQSFRDELIRRSVVLDFLALYRVAKEDGLVERVKHIIHASGFLTHDPRHWETYLTRLLGRCLRAHNPGYQAIEKERNSFAYSINLRQNFPELLKVVEMRKLVQLDWPWYPYGGQQMARYRGDPCLYWRTRGLVEPVEVDAMFAAWNQFYDRADRFSRVDINGDSLRVSYGNPGYMGRRRYYRSYANPSYFAHQAYLDYKKWIVLAQEFIENDAPFDTCDLLSEHDRGDDSRIEQELQDNAERQIEFLVERAAQHRATAEAEIEAEERETTLGENLMQSLRDRGLVE
jgi:hypothetical protein